MEEIKLSKIQERLKMYENKLQELQNMEASVETKDEEIDEKIK